MKEMIFTLLILAISSLGFMACENRAGHETRMTDSANQMSNAELERRIKSRLDADDQLRAANLKVNADEDKKVATLSGMVESEALRKEAIDLARHAQPELRIQDQIEITPTEISQNDDTEQMAREEWAKAKQLGGKVGNWLGDAWIHGKIVAKLIANSKSSQRTVSVDVNNNVVTLRGTVRYAEQKTEAERIAKETEGVRWVDNQLKVSA
jgi:osmotically-inducible protein OsmY